MGITTIIQNHRSDIFCLLCLCQIIKFRNPPGFYFATVRPDNLCNNKQILIFNRFVICLWYY